MESELVEASLKKAAEYEKEGKLLYALQFYIPILGEPDYGKIACIRLSEIYLRLGKYDLASSLLSESIESSPEDEDLRLFAGHFYLKNADFDKALEALSSVSRENYPEASLMTGMAYFLMDEYRLSLISLKTFIANAIVPDLRREAFIYMAKSYLELHQLEDAKASIDKAEDLSQDNPEILFTKARIYFAKEMYSHCYDCLHQALKISPGSPLFHKWAGRVLYKLGNYSASIEHLKESILAYQDPFVYSMMGLVYLKQNECSEAEALFLKALAINPDEKTALQGLNSCRNNTEQ